MKPLLIGIGNRLRGDDQIGPRLVDRLRERWGDAWDYTENRGDTLDLLDQWAGRGQVVVLDAMRDPAAQPGELRCWDAAAAPLPAGNSLASSHAFGLAEAIEMARALQRLPVKLQVVGIQGAAFGDGAALSLDIERCAAAVAEVIETETAEGER